MRAGTRRYGEIRFGFGGAAGSLSDLDTKVAAARRELDSKDRVARCLYALEAAAGLRKVASIIDKQKEQGIVSTATATATDTRTPVC